VGAGYRRAAKAISRQLSKNESLVAGTVCVPKGGLLRAGLSAGFSQAGGGGLIAGGLQGAIEGAAEGVRDRRAERQHQTRLPGALTLALTDQRLVAFAGRKVYKSYALAEVDSVTSRKIHVLGIKSLRFQIDFSDNASWAVESARIYYKDAEAFVNTLAATLPKRDDQ
jgi:hypothetical protein